MTNPIVIELMNTGVLSQKASEYYANLKNLHNYFHPDELEWRVARSGISGETKWAQLLVYVTSRAIMNRLDEVFGPTNWKNQIHYGPNGQVIQTIAIWDPFKKEWISKSDGAEETAVEAVKGGISGALKRAGVLFGIGRYLYEFGDSWGTECAKNTPGAIRTKARMGDKDVNFFVKPPDIPKQYLPGNEPWNKGK